MVLARLCCVLFAGFVVLVLFVFCSVLSRLRIRDARCSAKIPKSSIKRWRYNERVLSFFNSRGNSRYSSVGYVADNACLHQYSAISVVFAKQVTVMRSRIKAMEISVMDEGDVKPCSLVFVINLQAKVVSGNTRQAGQIPALRRTWLIR